MSTQAKRNRALIALPTLLLIMIAAGLLSRSYFSNPQTPTHATVLPSPAPLPEFEMSDHNGDAFGKDAFRNHWSLVFFGFTHCPDICPIALQQMASARRRMAEANPESILPDIVFISVDPDRDSVEILSQYVGAFGRNVIGVRGDPDELSKLTRSLGIFFEVSPGDDENYSVAHSAAVIVVNDNAEFHALFSAPYNIDTFVNDVPLIIAAK